MNLIHKTVSFPWFNLFISIYRKNERKILYRHLLLYIHFCAAEKKIIIKPTNSSSNTNISIGEGILKIHELEGKDWTCVLLLMKTWIVRYYWYCLLLLQCINFLQHFVKYNKLSMNACCNRPWHRRINPHIFNFNSQIFSLFFFLQLFFFILLLLSIYKCEVVKMCKIYEDRWQFSQTICRESTASKSTSTQKKI